MTTITKPEQHPTVEDKQFALNSNGVFMDLSETPKSAVDTPFKQLTNGSTPTGWIQIGTPKKWLFVIFDTGSDKLVAKTWETIAAELSSVDQGIAGMYLPSGQVYNHDTSTSYKRQYIKDQHGKDQPEQTSITYGSGTAITDVGKDEVLVGNRNLKNYTVMEITADSLQLLHTAKGIAGVLGLQHMKNKSLGNSLFSRMRDADLLTSFGYCRGSGNNGTFIWGAPEPDPHKGHEVDVIGDMHWAVHLGDVKIAATSASLIEKKSSGDPQDDGSGDGQDGGGADAPVDPKVLENVCPNATCLAILDTGSNIIAGPSDVMKAISQTVDVKPDCSNFDTLPHITLNFGGYPVSVAPSGYVMKVPKPDPSEDGGDGSDGVGSGHGEDGFARGSAGLLAEDAHEASSRQWKTVFERLHKNTGVDLREQVSELLKQENATAQEFLCMPALVPLDKHTKFGALYIVGTPLLDSYYARWSFAKDAPAPKIYLQPVNEAEVCKDHTDRHIVNGPASVGGGLMRKQSTSDIKAFIRTSNRGPTERRVEDIRYPHWAKNLLSV